MNSLPHRRPIRSPNALVTGTLLAVLCAGCGERGEPTSTGPAQPEAQDPWDLARSFVGQWVDSSHGALAIHEQWKLEGDSITGVGYVMSGEDTVSIEDLAMVRTAHGMEYRARISTQNDGQWVSFGLVPTGPDTLLFVAPAHDFPRSLRYVMLGDGELAVALEGVEQDGQREEHFRFRRVDLVAP